jgi:hypothetical protein
MDQFLKFTRQGKPLYIRIDQIQGVDDYKVYIIQDGTFVDVEDALLVFEKYIAEEKKLHRCTSSGS